MTPGRNQTQAMLVIGESSHHCTSFASYKCRFLFKMEELEFLFVIYNVHVYIHYQQLTPYTCITYGTLFIFFLGFVGYTSQTT